jgi:hypothetical protein
MVFRFLEKVFEQKFILLVFAVILHIYNFMQIGIILYFYANRDAYRKIQSLPSCVEFAIKRYSGCILGQTDFRNWPFG